MTRDQLTPETPAATPAPTRNLTGAAFDTALLLGGVYLTASYGGRLVKKIGQAGFVASASAHALTLFLFSLGVGLIVLAVPALQANLRRVPRDGAGRPLPQRDADGGESGG